MGALAEMTRRAPSASPRKAAPAGRLVPGPGRDVVASLDTGGLAAARSEGLAAPVPRAAQPSPAARTRAVPVAVTLSVLRIIPPVAIGAAPEPVSRLDGCIELLRHVAKRLHALWV